MLEAATILNVFYPHLIHIICLERGLKGVGEIIQRNFSEINNFISSTKGLTVKPPSGLR
jgi:hypothetical protein